MSQASHKQTIQNVLTGFKTRTHTPPVGVFALRCARAPASGHCGNAYTGAIEGKQNAILERRPPVGYTWHYARAPFYFKGNSWRLAICCSCVHVDLLTASVLCFICELLNCKR